jgi:uncharacterized membrane protein
MGMSDDKDVGAETGGAPSAPIMPDSPPKPGHSSLFAKARNDFLAGLVVVGPVGFTIWIVYWLLTGPLAGVDSFVKKIIPYGDGPFGAFVKAFPFLGLLLAIGLIVVMGAFARNFVGRAFFKAGEEIFDSLPVVRNLYGFFKNVFETALKQSARSFKEVALIEYPSKGIWALAFVVGDAKEEPRSVLSDQFDDPVSVFVPTVPNPTSGFLLYISRSRMKPLTMSIEEAAKLVFSIGLVVPSFTDAADAVQKLESMAATAKRPPFRLHIPGRNRPDRPNRNG